jgi:hypothetical protein
MAAARPLRDVFTDLVGAPGNTDDPAAVAEHLAPYVAAHSAVGADPGDEPPAGWLDLLGSAPDVAGDEPGDLDDLAPASGGFADMDGSDPDPALDFGTGAGPVSAPGTADGGGLDEDVSVQIPADLDDSVDAADWGPVEPVADLAAADLTDEASDDEGEPDGEPLG